MPHPEATPLTRIERHGYMEVETVSDLERLLVLARERGATGESQVKICVSDPALHIDDPWGDEPAGAIVRRTSRGVRLTFVPRTAVRRGPS